MMYKLPILILSMIVLYASTQTLPIDDPDAAIAKSFIAEVSHADSLTNSHYIIGRYKSKDYTPVKNHLGQWVLMKSTSGEEKNDLHALAPVFLKVQRAGTSTNYYPLDDDVDFYHFVDMPSTRWIVIGGRYSFYIYDTGTATLSHRLTPARHQYEGEDAISMTLSGFAFFDNDQFLFGHVQAYGIFCYAMSDPAQPKELRRVALSAGNKGMYYYNQGEYHLFLNPKENNLWDALLARSDINSVSKNIDRLYTRFEELRYVLKDISILSDDQGKLMVNICSRGAVNIKQEDGTTWTINLLTGEIVN